MVQTPFKKGEYVRYAANGVCIVEDIRKMPELKRGELFYILRPIADRNSTYFIPVTNEKLTSRLRALLSREEVDALIDAMRDVSLEWIEDRKTRTEQFHDALRTCDMMQLLVTVNTLYMRKQALAREGKKLAPSDDAVLKQAQALTDSEFSLVLDMPASDVGAYVRRRLGVGE